MKTNKAKRKGESFRIQVNESGGARSFIVRNDKGRVQLMSSSMTPLALSNIAGNNAALLSFALEDAADGHDAVAAVRKLGKYVQEATLL